MEVRLSDAAKEELREATAWYEDRQAGLGDDFKREVRVATEAIGLDWARFAAYEGGKTRDTFRRVLIERFPYVLIFQMEANEIIVHAVMHASREPGYWEKR